MEQKSMSYVVLRENERRSSCSYCLYKNKFSKQNFSREYTKNRSAANFMFPPEYA